MLRQWESITRSTGRVKEDPRPRPQPGSSEGRPQPNQHGSFKSVFIFIFEGVICVILAYLVVNPCKITLHIFRDLI